MSEIQELLIKFTALAQEILGLKSQIIKFSEDLKAGMNPLDITSINWYSQMDNYLDGRSNLIDQYMGKINQHRIPIETKNTFIDIYKRIKGETERMKTMIHEMIALLRDFNTGIEKTTDEIIKRMGY